MDFVQKPAKHIQRQMEVLTNLAALATASSKELKTKISDDKQADTKEVSLYKLEKKILRKVGQAIGDFNLIQDNDRILVAISGGKDSWVMLHALRLLQKKAPIKFTLIAVNIDQGYGDYRQDIIEDFVEQENYEYHMEEFDIARIVAEKSSPRSIPCSLCARLRRGYLSGLAEKHNCNKVALGHHLDDFIETLLLNSFFIGKLAAMAPKHVSDDAKTTVIRPLVYCHESDIVDFCKKKNFPIVCCECPLMCGGNTQYDSKRVFIKKMLGVLETEVPNIKQSILTSLGNVKSSHLLDTGLWTDK